MKGDWKHLLDTSAIFTLIEDEEGASRVDEIIRGGAAVIPYLVLLELYYVTLQEQSRAEADRRHALVKQLGLAILWDIDEPTLLTAARLKAKHRLSLADAQIAAFAVRSKLILVHKDPELSALHAEVLQETLPSKGAKTNRTGPRQSETPAPPEP